MAQNRIEFRKRLMKKMKKLKKGKKAKKMKKLDLGAIFDAHVRHEFVDHDVDATMKTMAAEPYVHNVPTLIGGDGHAGVVDFYTHHGRKVALPHVVVMKFKGGKVAHEHIYWDQACVSCSDRSPRPEQTARHRSAASRSPG